LGSRPRRLARLHSKREARESHLMLSGMNLHTPKWTLLWELESPWTPKFSESEYKGQNPFDSKVPYIVGKLLKLRCLKWAWMTHLDTSNRSYGQKKGRESNWQFDSLPLKVKDHPNFFASRWCATYCWKVIDEGYNFTLDFISIGGLHKKVMGLQSCESPNCGNFGMTFGCWSCGRA